MYNGVRSLPTSIAISWVGVLVVAQLHKTCQNSTTNNKLNRRIFEDHNFPIETMTWSAFFHAMRNGVAQRAAPATGRRAPQAANQQATRAGTRSASTQSAATTKAKEKVTCDKWDFMVLDVSASDY